jgi:hypothetical protein
MWVPQIISPNILYASCISLTSHLLVPGNPRAPRIRAQGQEHKVGWPRTRIRLPSKPHQRPRGVHGLYKQA